MGYFSQILAEPAAQRAAALNPRAMRGVSAQDLFSNAPLGGDLLNSFFSGQGIPNWAQEMGTNESGSPMYGTSPTEDTLRALDGYKFDWTQGDRRAGTLTAYNPSGQQIGAYNQAPEQSTLSSMLEAAALAAAGFGGVGLLGLGPLGGLLGGAGAAGSAGLPGGLSAGAVDAAALGLDAGLTAGAGGAGVGAGTVLPGSGMTLGGSAGYGTIGFAPGVAGGAPGAFTSVLGQGGAGLASGAGMTAPAFAGGGSGIVGGLGMTAGAGAAAGGGGLSGIGGYLSAAQGLAGLASGARGMNLASGVRNASDPFAQYRPGYGQQLAELEANPGSIVSRPGFQAGLETIGRKSAATGYYGSGNMASALSRYSGDFYNQEATRLAGLAGAGQTPGAGQTAAADLESRSLGSIGYSINSLLNNRSVVDGLTSGIGRLFGGG